RESQEGVNGYASIQLGILAGVILLALGSLSLTVVVMALVMLSLVGTVGALGFSGWPVNGISSAAPVVLMGLTVASAIHVVMAWQVALRAGADQTGALAVALDRNAKPVILSIVTTLLSFLVLNTAEAPPFRELGNIVALGLAGILALTFTLLPALLTLAPRSYGEHRGILERALGGMGAAAARRAKSVAAGGVVLIVGAVAGISAITVDDTFSHYFNEQYEVRVATDLFEEKLSGTTIIDLAVDTGAPGEAFSPQTLARTADIARWLEARPEVARVESLAAVAALIEDRGLPLSADNIQRTAARMAEAGVPRLITTDGQHVRTSIVMRGVSSRDTLAFRDELASYAGTVFDAGSVIVTGLPILSAQLSVGSARAMVIGMAIALTAISLLLVVTLRDWRLGLVSLVPNLVPVTIAFGIWGVFVGEVSFAVTVVAALTYGIVVDDTVHLLSKYQRMRAEAPNAVDAIRRAFRSVGIAVLVTTLALAASFMPFALSGFLVNRHFGALTALTLMAAIIADLVLLPALLAVMDKRKRTARVPQLRQMRRQGD
ncbi:MAG: efflux RND transporter permease subunit, partial [Pseudomonadota bacterium]